jgi:hypothetical protein
MATKERLAAMAASLCALCSGAMVAKLIAQDPNNDSLELRTYECAECGHQRTYSVDASRHDVQMLEVAESGTLSGAGDTATAI